MHIYLLIVKISLENAMGKFDNSFVHCAFSRYPFPLLTASLLHIIAFDWHFEIMVQQCMHAV